MPNPPGYVSPYTRPLCGAVYGGVLVPTVGRPACARREHTSGEWYDRDHRAEVPAAPDSVVPRVLSWV